MITGFEPGPGWWVLLLGWPAVFCAVVAFTLAVTRKSRRIAVIGCLLAAPMFFYLSLALRFHWVAPVAFFLLCLLTWRIKKSSLLVTSVFALPAASIMGWLAYAVITQ